MRLRLILCATCTTRLLCQIGKVFRYWFLCGKKFIFLSNNGNWVDWFISNCTIIICLCSITVWLLRRFIDCWNRFVYFEHHTWRPDIDELILCGWLIRLLRSFEVKCLKELNFWLKIPVMFRLWIFYFRFLSNKLLMISTRHNKFRSLPTKYENYNPHRIKK